MAIRFLLDENLRAERLYSVLWARDMVEGDLDVIRVGDPPDLPLGSIDPDVLAWADRNRRIVVSRDRRTLIRDYRDRARNRTGQPGLFILRKVENVWDVRDWLLLVSRESSEEDWSDRVTFIP